MIWKPFQLNPTAPKEGLDRKEYRAKKFGSAAYSKQLEDRVAAAGAEDGIHFHFDRIARTPNTFDAHRLIWQAGRQGNQDNLVEDLFEAYFINAEDIGDPEVLSRIAVKNGIEAGNDGQKEVAAEEHHARALGVNGVPAFFVGGKPVASGAQPPEVLAEILKPLL